MQLIGMLDSPYVRRVAISLQMLGLPFEHLPLSVFRAYPAFQRINPVVKAPTLICDDGEVLMDSTLIIEYAAALAGSGRSLMPEALPLRQHALRLVGLALAACEKSVALIYEDNLRPAEKRHLAWIDRVTAQLLAACVDLERELLARPLPVTRSSIDQAGISVAVAWHFIQQMVPSVVPMADFPALAAHSAAAEALPEFRAAAHGVDTFPVAAPDPAGATPAPH